MTAQNTNPVRRARDRWKVANPGKLTADFAAVLGFSVDRVYQLMRNECSPSPKRIVQIAELAGMTVGSVTRYFADNVGRSE